VICVNEHCIAFDWRPISSSHPSRPVNPTTTSQLPVLVFPRAPFHILLTPILPHQPNLSTSTPLPPPTFLDASASFANIFSLSSTHFLPHLFISLFSSFRPSGSLPRRVMLMTPETNFTMPVLRFVLSLCHFEGGGGAGSGRRRECGILVALEVGRREEERIMWCVVVRRGMVGLASWLLLRKLY
jgi:hypothetical protein